MSALVSFCANTRGTLYNLYMITEVDDGNSDGSVKKLPMSIKGIKNDCEHPGYSGVVCHMNKVYVIGGFDSNFVPKKDVLVFDLESCTSFVGPSLNSGKSLPIVVSVPSRIYVFSSVLNDFGTFYGNGIENSPRCEVLHNGSSVWAPFDLPSMFPTPPQRLSNSYFEYKIDAFAVNTNCSAVYLSIKDVCSYCVDFDGGDVVWTISPTELPFKDEGKRLGITDKYIGYSRFKNLCSCLCIYHLVEDTQDVDVFYFDQLCVFLPSSVPKRPYSKFDSNFEHLIQPLSGDTICILCCLECPDSGGQPHFITSEVFQLCWDNDKDGNQSTKKKKKNLLPRMKLLWHKRYRNIPLPCNFCFIKT